MKMLTLRIFVLFIVLFSCSLALKGQTIACGYSHHMVLCDDQIWSWGEGTSGQFGDGLAQNSMDPSLAVGISDVKSIYGGRLFSVALKNDGTVWSWGYNIVGQLGIGNIEPSSVPVQVAGLSNVKQLAVGSEFCIALLEDSTVWTWGSNSNGQLGNGTYDNSSVPIQVSGLVGIKSVHAGYFNAFAITPGGIVYGWGMNHFGALGLGTDFPSSHISPQLVPALQGAVKIQGGYWHTLVMMGNGSFLGCGQNNWGQLGLGHYNLSYQLQPVVGIENVVDFHTGNSTALALTADGSVYGWGYNNYGQVGDGTLNSRHTPFQIPQLSNVREVSTREWMSMALTESGDYYTWGQFYGGTWDGGNITSSSIPGLHETVCLVSDITEVSNRQRVIVYPNPSSGPVNIKLLSHDFQIKRIEIHNLTGQQVYSLNTTLSTDTTINLSHLTTGFYILTIHSNYDTYSEKLILE